MNSFSNLFNNFLQINCNGQITVLGYTIFLDDLLIILLLIFLYNEQVSNQFLYFILIVLLLSDKFTDLNI